MELFAYAIFFATMNWIFYRLSQTKSFAKQALVLTLVAYAMVVLMVQYHLRARVPGLSNEAFFLLIHLSFVQLLFKFLALTTFKQISPTVPGETELSARVQAMYQQVIPATLPWFITVIQWVLLFTGWAVVLGDKMQ